MSLQTDLKGTILENNYNTLVEWNKIGATCPYCLYVGKLKEFATYLKTRNKKVEPLLSKKRVKCPDCNKGMITETVKRVYNMNMEEYSYYLWEMVFCWRAYEDVNWEKLRTNLRMYPREEQDRFWEVHREFKDSNDKHQVIKDREMFLEYKENKGEFNNPEDFFTGG